MVVVFFSFFLHMHLELHLPNCDKLLLYDYLILKIRSLSLQKSVALSLFVKNLKPLLSSIFIDGELIDTQVILSL